MPPKPRWLLAIPDAISQLEKLDRTLLTRRDIERLFGVSKARAATLMQTFGAELVGNQRTLPRTKLLQQLKKHRGRAAFRGEEERRARLVAELQQARLTGVRFKVPAETMSAQLANLPEGVSVARGRIEVRFANARTRAAYGRAVGQFLGWCEARGLGLRDVSPLHVAAYIRTHPGSAPTVKQHLTAIRMLGDWLVVKPGPPREPRRGGSRPEARRHQGGDAGPLAGGGEEAPRVDRHGHPGGAPGQSSPLGHALQLRAGERGVGDAATGPLRAGEPGGGSGSTRRAGSGTTFRPTIGLPRPSTPTSSRAGLRSRRRRSSRV